MAHSKTKREHPQTNRDNPSGVKQEYTQLNVSYTFRVLEKIRCKTSASFQFWKKCWSL